MPTTRRRQANNALGFGLVALMFLGESWVAHQSHPSPASPFIWAVSGIVALAGFGYYARYRRL